MLAPPTFAGPIRDDQLIPMYQGNDARATRAREAGTWRRAELKAKTQGTRPGARPPPPRAGHLPANPNPSLPGGGVITPPRRGQAAPEQPASMAADVGARPHPSPAARPPATAPPMQLRTICRPPGGAPRRHPKREAAPPRPLACPARPWARVLRAFLCWPGVCPSRREKTRLSGF